MARQPRLAMAGELHLVVLRGHNDQPVFADDADRAAFAGLLREAVGRNDEIAIHAYALLANEVHLLVTPARADAMGRLVQSIGRRYVAAYNRRHARRGTLWDGRFRSCVVDAQTLLLAATVYVETLPVAAGLAAAAAEWPWSSAAHHVGRQRDPLVTDHPCYWRLGNTPFEREHAHTVAIGEAQQHTDDARFAEATQRALVVGPAAFRARVAEALDRVVQPRPRGRPRRTNSVKTVPI
jgi:putative transposase